MPTVSQIGLKKSRTQVDIEKSRKTAHRETIAKANLTLIKQAIDRSATFRSNSLMQDQKVIYRRFHNKLLTTQLNHARLAGDKQKLREVKLKLRDMRLLDDDEEYEFFRRLRTETALERTAQLGGRVATAPEEDTMGQEKRDDDEEDSEMDEEDFTMGAFANGGAPVFGHSSAIPGMMTNSSGGSFNTTPSPTGGTFTPSPINKPSAIRIPPQSARLPTSETPEVPKPTPRSVTFQDKASVVRPETHSKAMRGSEAEEVIGRSKSCQPELPSQSPPSLKDEGTQTTPSHPPPEYDEAFVEKQQLPQQRPLSGRIPGATKVTSARDVAIVAVAAANSTTSRHEGRIKSAVAGDRSGSISPKPAAPARPTTASNIFAKKEGPTKLERHEDWLRRRNYKTAVRDFCDSLFVIPKEPEPVAKPPTPKEEEPKQPKQRELRGARRMSVAVEPTAGFTALADQQQPAAAAPKPKPVVPISIFTTSELLAQDMMMLTKHRAPIFELPVDPVELRREAGNPKVRNLTMSRVFYR